MTKKAATANPVAETERRLVLGLLFDPERFGEVEETLTPAHFTDKPCAVLFEAMLALYRAGEEPNASAISQWLKGYSGWTPDGGWDPVVSKLLRTSGTSSFLRYDSALVRRRHVVRRLHVVGATITETASTTNPATEEAVEDAVEEAVDGVLATQALHQELAHATGPVASREALREALLELESEDRKGDIDTGLSDLDMSLLGLRRGQLVVVAARPSVGKSTMGIQMLCNMTSGEDAKRGFLVSGEMSRVSVAQKVIARYAEVDSLRLRSGSANTAERQRIHAAVAEMHLGFEIYDRSTTVGAIRAMTRMLKARKGCDVVMVDYLQQMRAPRLESRVAEVAYISKSLKELAKDQDVLVIAMAQLNREAHGEEPQMKHLKESGAIEQDADVIVFLWPDDWKDRSAKPVINVRIAKNREGRLGSCSFVFDKPECRFRLRARSTELDALLAT